MKVTIELNSLNACRTNTGRAHTRGKQYDLGLLAYIGGADFKTCINDLDWCAEEQDDESAIQTITNFANALLSAYEIQRDSYKTI